MWQERLTMTHVEGPSMFWGQVLETGKQEQLMALLKEENESMRRRMERAEQKTADMAALQVKCDQLQEKLDQLGTADQHGVRRPM